MNPSTDTHLSQTALLLDVGSTSAKGAVIDTGSGETLSEARAAMPQAFPGLPTRHETDPGAVLTVVRDLAEELTASLPGPPQQAVLSTQMHSCLLTDQRNLPISPIITWQDDRLLEPDKSGMTHLDALAAEAPPGVWDRSGIARRPGFGGGNLGRWRRENSTVSDSPTTRLRVHTLGSFLSASLGGPYATGLSNAASLGLVDVHTGVWSEELTALHDLAECDLPQIIDRPSASGTISVGGAEITWLGDLGDHQASVLGSGGLGPDELAISLGTAGIAARLADRPSTDPRVDSRPYVDGRYLLAVSRQPGGALATEFAHLLGHIAGYITETTVSVGTVWERLASLPETAQSSGQMDLSEELYGQRTLKLSGISPAEPLESLYLGFLMHYAEAYQKCIELLFPAPEDRPTRLKFNGGFASRNVRFRTTLAQSLNLDINDIPPGELALEGLRTLVMTSTSTSRRNHP